MALSDTFSDILTTATFPNVLEITEYIRRNALIKKCTSDSGPISDTAS